MNWLWCLLFGHNWSAWMRVVRIDNNITGPGASEPVWTTNSHWETRGCERGHLEWRGFDWDEAPEGVITVEKGVEVTRVEVPEELRHEVTLGGSE